MRQNQLAQPFRTRITARQIAHCEAVRVIEVTKPAPLRKAVAPAIIAVRCMSNWTAGADGGLDRYGHLTPGGIYQATHWRSLEGDLCLIIRTDDGNHSLFPYRHFHPVNPRHWHLWPLIYRRAA